MSNRELDERVARALGWTIALSDTGDPWQEKPERYRTLRAYSSDWSCCEEMLAHLRKFGTVTISFYEGCDGAGCWCCCYHSEGATLPEALARLCVAVAGAKEKKQ